MPTAGRDGAPGPRKRTGKAQKKRTDQPAARQSPKKTHRKGQPKDTGRGRTASKPDVETGRVRLNNARPARHQTAVDPADSGATYVADGVRLQKVLAQAGVASRRGAEEMIAAGRVEIDGEIVTEQGLRIDPDTAIIRVDGARVIIDETRQYLALNKPRG